MASSEAVRLVEHRVDGLRDGRLDADARASSHMESAARAPSTTMPVRASYSSSDSPAANDSPKVRLREWTLVQVATRSPMPARPMQVSGSPPMAAAMRPISARPRVMMTARALSPAPKPAAMPQAMAMTFFTAAHTSTPTRSSEA